MIIEELDKEGMNLQETILNLENQEIHGEINLRNLKNYDK